MKQNPKYDSLAADFAARAADADSTLLGRGRQAALDALSLHGLPDGDEEWLYTDLAPALAAEWTADPRPPRATVDMASLFRCDVPELDTHLVVSVNGHYMAGAQAIPGVTVATLSRLDPASADAQAWAEMLASGGAPRGVDALNAAMAADGIALRVARGATVDKPIQIINILHGDTPRMSHTRNLIHLEPGASAQIVVCDHAIGGAEAFATSRTTVRLDDDARLELYNIQNMLDQTVQLTKTEITQAAGSQLHAAALCLHGGLARNETRVTLQGRGAECDLSGLSLADRGQKIDTHTDVDHQSPGCTSNQLYKGIYDDQATGSFTGRVAVRPGAQQTAAYQSNRNLLLTDQATANARPQLEIYADEVKCSHGASTGVIDPDAMFYLRARGIDLHEARMLMMYAFANEIVSKIKIEPLAARIEEMINRRLRGERSRCSNCVKSCG